MTARYQTFDTIEPRSRGISRADVQALCNYVRDTKAKDAKKAADSARATFDATRRSFDSYLRPEGMANVRLFDAKVRDKLLGITPGEPTAAPDLGTLYDGNGPRRFSGTDIDAVVAALEQDSLLSPAEIAKMKAALAKYGAGTRAVAGSAGVASFDGYATDANRQAAQAGDQIRGMNEAARSMWDGIQAQHDVHRNLR